jgi:hypothetical protein
MPNADPTWQDAAVVLAILAAMAVPGLVTGWWLVRQPRARQVRWALLALALALVPLAGLLVSQVLRSDALGWMAGLSLMVLLPLGVPFVVGALSGWTIGRLMGRKPPTEAPKPDDMQASAATPTVTPTRAPDDRQAHFTPSRSLSNLGVRNPDSLGALLAVVGVGAGFVVVLGAGFRLSGDTAPAGLDHALWPAVAVLVAVVAWFVRVMVPRWRQRAAQTRVAAHQRRDAEAWIAKRDALLTELDADPRLRPYAQRIRAGELWTREGIAYDLNPQALACCEHLQALERDLRRDVPGVRRLSGLNVHAPCQLDVAALQRREALPACVLYEEPIYRDRQGDDEPGAQLRCELCNSTITAWHERVAPRGTPVFP